MSLISKEFDDIYFSKENGLHETEHVFLKGCNLPHAWKNQTRFTIFETGFGTGLNCISAAKLFQSTSKPSQMLDIISVEKYPLTKSQIKESLSQWNNELSPYLDTMIEQYPLRIEGIHSIRLDRNIHLHLCFGDIKDILFKLSKQQKYNHQNTAPLQIDAWFLDGFAPAKNPDMWCDELFRFIKSHSHSTTKLATFTAAGAVKRGLEDTGLNVSKTNGFGRKRDMLAANSTINMPRKMNIKPQTPSNVAIIGGGLAGASIAHQLSQQNIPHTLFEAGKEIAVGASGNPLGLINPKLTAKPTAEGDFYTSAYNTMLTHAKLMQKENPDIAFHPLGSMHLNISDDKARRFKGYIENLNWHIDHMQHCTINETNNLLRLSTDYDALHFPDAASINPKKLCESYIKHTNIHLNTAILDISHEDQEWFLTDQNGQIYKASHLVIACANGALKLGPSQDLPIHKVRGQITLVQNHEHLQSMQKLLCFGGYLSPYSKELNGHVLGASYKHWDDSRTLKDEDDEMNIERLNAVIPDLIDHKNTTPLRASQRLSSKDRIPLIGKKESMDENPAIISNMPALYYSLAHGSHGLISSALAARIITADIEQRFIPLYSWSRDKMSPNRF